MPEATPAPIDLDAGLARLGYTTFRPGQREAIEILLREGRLLLVAPTGGGKSLVFQLPATLLPRPTLVISPLVALMQDQVQALAARGVPVTFLSATLEAGEVRRRMGAIANGAVRLVYAAPERLAFAGFRGLMREVAPDLVAIDEAHCISEWGHDFRPDYLQIGDLLAELGSPRVLACTATATPVVRDEILARLGLPADTTQLVRGFARPNLILRALEVSGARERSTCTDGLLAEALGAPGAGRGVAIVYAPTRRGADEEADRLAQRGWRAAPYHAGLDGPARDAAQRAFREGRLEVVAATVAFGMGIDRPDVRAVVHLAPPGSIEAYYQEVGRAGRDGAPAWGLMLTSPGDLPLRRRLLEGTSGITPVVLEHKWGLFLELLRWAEGGSCRHDAILRYFGDEAETLAGCGRCDICERIAEGADPGEPEEETVSLLVRKALSGVARVHGRFGLLAAVALLHGASDERLLRAGLTATSTFGVMRDRPVEWLQRLLRRCITAGWVDITADERPLVRLTDAGRAVMKGERPARLLLPPAGLAQRSRRAGGIGRDGGRPSRVPGRGGARPSSADGAESARFEALRRHRLEVARAHRVPPYVVASDRSLHEMATLVPRTLAELAAVFGFGPGRTDKYGAGFLAVLAAPSAPDAAP